MNRLPVTFFAPMLFFYISFASAASSEGNNYQLSNFDNDSGGGSASNAQLQLVISAIGTSYFSGSTISSSYNFSNSIFIDDDGDGLENGAEILAFGTDPNLTDSDADTFSDLVELLIGWNPLIPDSPPVNVPIPFLASITLSIAATLIFQRNRTR